LKPLLAAPQAAGSFAPALWIGAGCAVASALVAARLLRQRTAVRI
jgi:hypothetical protein